MIKFKTTISRIKYLARRGCRTLSLFLIENISDQEIEINNYQKIGDPNETKKIVGLSDFVFINFNGKERNRL